MTDKNFFRCNNTVVYVKYRNIEAKQTNENCSLICSHQVKVERLKNGVQTNATTRKKVNIS